MAAKYIRLNSGVPTEQEATVASSGASDAGKIIALNASGDLDASMLPPGIGADTVTVTASEALAAGDFVNVYDSSGAKARKADASTAGKPANGFVLASVSNGASATVYVAGTNNSVSGGTVGPVFLSATVAGGFTSTAPSGTGQVVQQLGVCVSATEIIAALGQQYVLA